MLVGMLSTHFFFFFCQAEDGIRVRTVTGVQTCALPIFRRDRERTRARAEAGVVRRSDVGRSEERRVGKSVDLGGRRIIKKKKKKKQKERRDRIKMKKGKSMREVKKKKR